MSVPAVTGQHYPFDGRPPVLPPTLSYTIHDGTGQVDVLAVVSSGSDEVKLAAADPGEPEASDAAVRGATPDTSAPFAFANVFTLDPGESRAVSAFAYRNTTRWGREESQKATLVIVRPGGGGGGTEVALFYSGQVI